MKPTLLLFLWLLFVDSCMYIYKHCCRIFSQNMYLFLNFIAFICNFILWSFVVKNWQCFIINNIDLRTRVVHFVQRNFLPNLDFLNIKAFATHTQIICFFIYRIQKIIYYFLKQEDKCIFIFLEKYDSL